jgi:hypothetical protein
MTFVHFECQLCDAMWDFNTLVFNFLIFKIKIKSSNLGFI